MLNKLYKSKLYPLTIQLLTLVVFILLIIGSIGVTTEDASFAKQLRNTNLSNLVVWSYWWPFIVIAAVFLGRHWCSICPIELISAITTGLGLKRKPPKFLKTGWAITFLYVFIAIVAIHVWGIHRIPQLMAFYLLSLIILALITSLIFEKRAFCSYFCPVGKLLGLYSLLAPLGLRVEEQNVCLSCKSKDCINKKNNQKIIGRSCQSDLYPAHISDNRECILCTQCVKVCPKENISIQSVKKPFLSFDINNLSGAEVGILVVLSGFVSYEILSSWEVSKTFILTPSNWASEMVLSENINPKLLEGLMLFLIVPLIVIIGTSALLKLLGDKSLPFYAKRLTGYLLPVIAFGHVFKALLKTTSRIPYWQYALEKPQGLYFAEKILNAEITINNFAWLGIIVMILGMSFLLLAVIISLRKLKDDLDLQLSCKIIVGLLVVFYGSMLLYGPVSGF